MYALYYVIVSSEWNVILTILYRFSIIPYRVEQYSKLESNCVESLDSQTLFLIIKHTHAPIL